MVDCVNALKQWTGKASATIIYDSTVDEFTDDGLFEKVKGKPDIALVGVTTDGDIFGGFYSVAVTELWKRFNDHNIFAFSFESHGRCMTPQRFLAKKGLKGEPYVAFCKKYNLGFVYFGADSDGSFFLGNERSDSYCWDMSRVFEGCEDTTFSGENNLIYHCTRLVAIQLE